MKRSLRVRESVSHYERKLSEPDLLTGDGERHQAARFLSVVVRDVFALRIFPEALPGAEDAAIEKHDARR